jgi:D-alanine-D-alanine ligase
MGKKIKIALIFGGRSAEHDISLLSAASIHGGLNKKTYDISSIYIGRDGSWKAVESPAGTESALRRGRSFSFLPWKNKAAGPCGAADIYFPILHGPYGEDGTIQGLLEMADVPYVGAGVLASAAGMDKAVMKTLFGANGLPIVRHRTIDDTAWPGGGRAFIEGIKKSLPLPWFVKPANLGSSVGISKVKTPAKLRAAIDLAFGYDRRIIVEEGIVGREFECSVLGNDHPRASLPGEVIPYRDFYDYSDKYLDGKTEFVVPAKLPRPVVRRIMDLAVGAFKAVGAAGMSRVDFLYEESKRRLFVNEINTIPGFTSISMYPRLWEASGLPFSRLLDELIRLGFERHRMKKRRVDRGPC